MSRASRLTLLLAALVCLAATTVSAQTPAATVQDGSGNVRLQSFVNGQLLVPGPFNDGATIPATGSGTRLMWWPEKAAFRAGRVGVNKDGTQWDPDSIGDHSVAFGVDTKARGSNATAMGNGTKASAFNATAMGAGTEASGGGATAMGNGTTASGGGATAMGNGTTASGGSATAMGEDTEASGRAATAMGEDTEASDIAATAMGNGTTASGRAATAMGEDTEASGDAATAIGKGTIANNEDAFAIGKYNDSIFGTNIIFAVGNGTTSAPTDRSNALDLDLSGNLEISGSLNQNSDRRLKTGIESLADGILEQLGALRPVRYEFKNQKTHPSGQQIGLVAQDVRKEFPALVSEGSDGMLSLAYPKLTAVLLKGLQEQQTQLEKKNEQIAKLRADQRQIQERLAALEAEEPPVAAGWVGGGLLRAFGLLLIGGLLGGVLVARLLPDRLLPARS